MTTLREAAQQALEALEEIADEVFSPYDNKLGDAILALRAALAEPVQQGCNHCNQPLYAAIKCRVCGRVTEPVQEPVAWLPPDPPPECKSEAEKTAFAFGWFKALETQRLAKEEAIYETIIQWDEGLQVGNFALSRYDEASYWLAHKDGEGMQVKQERLQRLIDELWQEF